VRVLCASSVRKKNKKKNTVLTPPLQYYYQKMAAFRSQCLLACLIAATALEPALEAGVAAVDEATAEALAAAAAAGPQSTEVLECTDSKEDCFFWSTVGHCEDNSHFMLSRCPLSCGSCTPPEPRKPVALAGGAIAGARSPRLVLLSGADGATHQPLGLPAGEIIVELSAGELHLLVRTESGAVFALGDNSLGQLGRPLSAAREPYTAWQPFQLRWPAGVGTGRAVSVSAGRMHSAAVLEGGAVVTWGDNTQGQCGMPLELTPLNPAPTELGDRS